MQATSILVIEDSDSIRNALVLQLSKVGYEVHSARDGREGYRLLLDMRHTPPQLILLDLIMPNFNGMQLGTLLRHDSRFDNVPVIIMSAWPATETAKAIGAVGVLVKPFHPEALLAIVAKYCIARPAAWTGTTGM